MLLRALLPLVLLAACAAPNRPASTPAVTLKPPPMTAKPSWQARKVVPDAVTTSRGRVHTVKSGETGIAIARAYGVPWNKIVAANRLSPPYVLEIGDRLLLPSAKQAAAQAAALSPEARAKAFSLDIDDLVTGGEPADTVRGKGGGATAIAPPPRAPRPAPRPAPRLPRAIPSPDMIDDAPPFLWPVDGRIMSSFGAKPGGRFNDGVNLKASAGAPVRAAGDGVVAYAGDAIPGFGNLILIKHAGGWVTAYGHAEALLVTRGTAVKAGDVIARAGATGAVNEPQVHFETRRGRTPIDPAKVIAAR